MNSSEYADCIRRLSTVFPELGKYLASQSRDTKDAWASQFEPFDKRDLLAAVERVVAGFEQIAAYEYERATTILLRITRELRNGRLDRERRRVEREAPAANRPAFMGKAFARICQRIDAEAERQGIRKRELAPSFVAAVSREEVDRAMSQAGIRTYPVCKTEWSE